MARHAHARRRRHRRRHRRLYVGSGALALALIALLLNGGLPFRGGSRAVGSPGEPAGCATPAIELRLISSAEKVAALGAIAEAYQRTQPAVDGRCLKVNIGHASAALGTGLSGVSTGLPGRPDVWTPESTLWVKAVANSSVPMQVIAAMGHQSIATSPTVLAMPRPMAEALGWPDQKVGFAKLQELAAAKTGWAAFGHPEWGAFRVDRIDPRLSTAKAQATLALAYNVTGTVRPSAADVAGERVVRALLKLDRAPGPTDADPTVFLAGLRDADGAGKTLRHVSVAALDEMSVLAYNHGNSIGVPMNDERSGWPKVPLAAFYPPEGTFVSDHPYVILTDAPDRRRAAKAFLDHLLTPAAQATLQRYGFRDRRGVAAAEVTPDLGVLPRQPGKILPHPEPDVVSAILQDVGKLRTRSNVLTVLDVSGSMAAKVSGSLTRMDLCKRAAINSLSLYDTNDDGGLWKFSTAHRELVRLGPLTDRMGAGLRRDMIRREIERLVPGGDTTLYNTAWAAHQRVVANYQRDTRNSVILLTDGRNDISGGLTLKGLLAKLKKSDRFRPVRIIFIAYGEGAPVPALRQIAAATGGAVFAAPNPTEIDRVFAAAIAST
jgi:Ca-activated chloride channel family protein